MYRYQPCENCGFQYSSQTKFGRICRRCFAKKSLAADRDNRFEQIERRKIKFKIDERIIDGQVVKVKICPPAYAEGCFAGLKTRPVMEHAKTHKNSGKYRRA